MKVVFLDRDGVINQYPGDAEYIKNWGEFKFIPKSIDGIKILRQKDFKIFVISNQAGVGKGLYSQQDLELLTQNMHKALKEQGTSVDKVYYCTHKKEANCSCRKPKTGLLENALAEFNIKPNKVYFIGDSFIDMNTARNFSIPTILVLSGKEQLTNRSNWPFEPDYIFPNLFSAAKSL